MMIGSETQRGRRMNSRDAIPLPESLGMTPEETGGAGYLDSMFRVNTSDFHLAEETDRADDDAQQQHESQVDKGPIHAIGIRAFKMLELLRRQRPLLSSASEASTHVTTVRLFIFIFIFICSFIICY